MFSVVCVEGCCWDGGGRRHGDGREGTESALLSDVEEEGGRRDGAAAAAAATDAAGGGVGGADAAGGARLVVVDERLRECARADWLPTPPDVARRNIPL